MLSPWPLARAIPQPTIEQEAPPSPAGLPAFGANYMDQTIHTLEALLTRYSDIDKLAEVQRVRFADAVHTGEDPLHVIKYLGTLGIAVKAPADLFVLNDDPNEEEVNAFWVPEGVAVSINSDDAWLVFEVDGADTVPGGARV
jgi:hypothetical protein